VRLRPAAHGGLTALVWLPDEVITHETSASPSGFRRFEVSAPGSGGDGGSAAAWPVLGTGDDRAAAVQALTAARAPRFAPRRPDADTGSCPAIGADDPAVASPAGADQAPGAAGPAHPAPAHGQAANGTRADDDQLSSVADAPTGALPVFGSSPLGSDTRGLARNDELSLPSLRTDIGEAPPSVIVPPAAGSGEENRLPIFESVESDWFRRGRHSADRTARTEAPVVSGTSWTSPADEGWRAAEVVSTPVAGGTTVAGLPKRVPKANLVPGGVGGNAPAAGAAPSRSAAQARDRLASFQRGIREARVAARDDDTPGGEDNSGT
jgi:hypothetical protein